MFTQNNFNEEFKTNTRQFADAIAQVSRLALNNVGNVFDLQMNAFQANAEATLSFCNKAIDARDMEDVKALWPKGVQVARENIERTVGVTQESFGHTVKANEAIAQVAKQQFETATAKVKETADRATTAAKKATKA